MPDAAINRGKWISSEDGTRMWDGPLVWHEPHGESMVTYSLGNPVVATNVRHSDGFHIPRIALWNTHRDGIWRRDDPDGDGYILGRAEFRDDGVIFTDDHALNDDVRNGRLMPADTRLVRNLMQDGEFMERIQDDEFAAAVYASFCNKEWRNLEGYYHQTSWRTSGKVVAALRRRGESYLDWYPAGPEIASDVSIREVEAHFERLGWKEVTDSIRAADRAEAMRLLDEIEKRGKGTFPVPSDMKHDGAHSGDDPYARAMRAFEDGRASKDELDLLIGRF